jgi:hypothetical protein
MMPDAQRRSFGVLKRGGALAASSQPPSPEEAGQHRVMASMMVTGISPASLETVARMIDAGE